VSLALSQLVADREMLARYILPESWLYKDDRAGSPLKPNAFMPYRGEVSVFRVDGLNSSEKIAIGQAVANERERKHREAVLRQGHIYPETKCTFRYRGRGELTADDVHSCGLDVVSQEPPERHANICGWPPPSGNKRTDEAAQILYAIKLQQKATFIPASEFY
jgi:hypothetical protein